MNKKHYLKSAVTILCVAVLAVLLALSYQLFVVKNNFAPAGLNGIATMIQYKTGFSIGYMSLIINVPLCIFAYFTINKRFAALTLTFCVVYSFSFLYFQQLGLQQLQYAANGHNTIFPVLLSGITSGFVYGICFKNNASTGGVDVISKYVSYKRPHINFFWMTFILNTAVAAASFFVYAKPDATGKLIYDYSPVCLSVLYSFFSSFMGNYIIKNIKSAVRFTIITESPDEIAEEITTKLRHTSTALDAMGSYKHEKKTILICVINKHQIIDLQNIIKKYENTFAFSESVTETYGNFKKIK